MASLTPAVSTSSDQAMLPAQNHMIMVWDYQPDDMVLLHLNSAVEDALSKILKFGFNHIYNKPAMADSLRKQVLAWAKHIAGEILGYGNWQEIYNFTFEALHTVAQITVPQCLAILERLAWDKSSKLNN